MYHLEKKQNLNQLIIYNTTISDFEVRSTISKIFKTHNPLLKYSVRIYKIDPFFDERFEEIIQIDDSKGKYILFKIDIYFSESSLAVEIDKKNVHKAQKQKVKRQKALEKKLNCKFFKVNKSNDFNYELGNIHSFIDEFKNNKI